MSAMERTKYRQSLRSNTFPFDEPGRDPRHVPYTSGSSMADFSLDDSIPLFMPDLHGQSDPRMAASQRTRVLPRIPAGGLAIAAFVILIAVFNSDATRVLIDTARASDQSAAQAASNQPAVRQIPLKDPARESDPMTLAGADASNPRSALQSQASAERTGNEAAAPSNTLDAETLAALMTRAKRLLGLGDIAAARLLLERAANAQDATAAFLLALTYDPAVLGARDTRSITPDPVMARDWYCKAANFGSTDAQQRLTQLQNNLYTSEGCHASVP